MASFGSRRQRLGHGRSQRDAGSGAAGRGAPIGPAPGATKGHQVFKFGPDGKLLMTLGKPGGAVAPDYFYQPNDVLVAPGGDIFVSEGHGAGNNRILKFSKDGKFIKSWGKPGTGPGEFDVPHALAMDSRGRLFIGDRYNTRIQIFDQDGKFLNEFRQFGRPSGIYIDKNDTIYVADSASDAEPRTTDGWKRGIRIGSARDGSVKSFIPDPVEKASITSAAEGVVVDAEGNLYGAEVGPRTLTRYVKKWSEVRGGSACRPYVARLMFACFGSASRRSSAFARASSPNQCITGPTRLITDSAGVMVLDKLGADRLFLAKTMPQGKHFQFFQRFRVHHQ